MLITFLRTAVSASIPSDRNTAIEEIKSLQVIPSSMNWEK
jgi:hypothetical protein